MDNLILIPQEGELQEEDKKTVREGMLSYHAGNGHIRKEKDDYFSIVIKDTDNITVGALVASFRWEAMHIETLWIAESIRRQGLGSRLMQTAEKEAVKRGCYLAYTDTFNWQAPKFYEKLGYTLYGRLEEYPKGNYLSYYRKRLDK